jgi:hypothetical protein
MVWIREAAVISKLYGEDCSSEGGLKQIWGYWANVQIICRTKAQRSSFGDVYSQSRCRSDERTAQMHINQKIAEGVVVRKERQQSRRKRLKRSQEESE